MLRLTNEAQQVFTIITRQSGANGMRITPVSGMSPKKYALTPSTAPLAEDWVLVMGGARVFLDSETARALNSRVLDAAVDLHGALRFSLAPAA